MSLVRSSRVEVLLQDGKSCAFSNPWRTHVEADSTMLELCLAWWTPRDGVICVDKACSYNGEAVERAAWECWYHVSFTFNIPFDWEAIFPFRDTTHFIRNIFMIHTVVRRVCMTSFLAFSVEVNTWYLWDIKQPKRNLIIKKQKKNLNSPLVNLKLLWSCVFHQIANLGSFLVT